MSTENILAIGENNIEAFNNADWDTFRAGIADNCVYDEIGTGRRLEGADALIELLKGWRAAGPDCKGEITNSLRVDGTVVLEITWTATHEGPLETPDGTIPASGKQWTIRSVQVIEFEGDRAKEMRNYLDILTMMKQIGAV